MLEMTLQDSAFVAKGNYERQQSGGGFLGLGLSSKTPPMRCTVEYRGSLRGCAIKGTVAHERDDERQSIKNLLGSNETETRFLMVLSDDKSELRVMERKQGAKAMFYKLRRELS